jgi:hypothetical protein
VQVQDEQLEENIYLKLAIYIVIMEVKICLKRVSPIVGVWGSNPQDFTKQAQSRKVIQLEKIKIVIIHLK